VNGTSPDPVLAALDLIEEAEARNIAWGLLDESWTRATLVDVLREQWDGTDPEGCVDELVARNLLVKLPKEWPTRFRTRMAEAVRLFSRLRQLFPNKPWQASSTLVSDVRFLRRARTFPDRNIDVANVLHELADKDIPTTLLTEVERVLAGRRLSRFQVSATSTVFSALSSRKDHGVVVGAGTGSGKTLAFYLPVLAWLAASGRGGPRAIAIYPRNELLKDQLATALREVRGLRSAGGRPLSVGAYFGPTPWKAGETPDPRGGWRRQGEVWICPFLTCLTETAGKTCDGALSWRPAHAQGAHWGELVCLQCKGRVTSQELRLTRDSMAEDPPDILFTTTEMLNQQLSDGWSRHVFGVGAKADRPPAVVLLDEIHTYAGTSGAQVAYLLRRWRTLLDRPVTWVGLSATLANADAFFADLCGVEVDDVDDIRPQSEDDMVRNGSEYQILLRGDPASQSALLSTTIQSLMLLRRILDENPGDPRSPYGTRVFAFLDNLDLVNRLYRQVLSAEGRDPFGKRDPRATVLAVLRGDEHAHHDRSDAEYVALNRAGQHWWLPEQLGFGVRSLKIARTSSQDIGVDSGADLVVATASLEVGYDDPRVGAVLQHKAPRDVAQFLQRRGRAGRSQIQRPWTVVVLSDYGRDRLAFQSYESILDPAVQAKSLPLGNQSVRKMQAAMCLVDWVAVRLDVDNPPWAFVRRNWASPGRATKRFTESCIRLLQEVLDGGSAQQDLIEFIQSSLDLGKDEVESLCWEHPRSLLMEVVPTIHRRLTSDWATVQAGQVAARTDIAVRQPLPEFIPSTLFTDLVLPEVEIVPPQGYDSAADTSMPVGMGLNELAPGKVTLRWAVQAVKGLWIEPPASGVVELEDALAPGGQVVIDLPTGEGPVPLVRPVQIRPVRPDPEVLPTSNGALLWRFLFDREAVGTDLPRPTSSPLGDLIPGVRAFLSVDQGSLRTWRYALQGTAEVVTRRGRDRRDYTFTRGGQPAAIGFPITVDALAVTVAVPASVAAFDLAGEEQRLRQLRTDRFATLAKHGLEDVGLSPFTAGWVVEVAVSIAGESALLAAGVAGLLGLPPSEWQSLAESVVDGVMLATVNVGLDELPLRETVLNALGNPKVTRVLEDAVPALGEDPDESWLPWIRSRFLHTVAAAWQFAAQQVCPDFNIDLDALVDVVDDGGPDATIVLCDAAPGGGSVVETLTRRLADDPRRFDTLVAAATEPTDTEEVDPSLRRVLDILVANDGASDAAERFRRDTPDRFNAWQLLIARLGEEGVVRTHVNLAALSTRVFQPGSGPESDDLLRLILAKWDEFDAHSGFAIDHRAVCAFLAKDDEVLGRLDRIASPANRGDAHIRAQSVLLSLLWTRAVARRPETLRVSNRYSYDTPATERTLLRAMLPEPAQAVDVDSTEWRQELADALKRRGEARLSSSSGNAVALAAAVRELMVDPVEVDWLYAHPQVEGLGREGGRHWVSVTLREAPL
jgi:hypothetical protein